MLGGRGAVIQTIAGTMGRLQARLLASRYSGTETIAKSGNSEHNLRWSKAMWRFRNTRHFRSLNVLLNVGWLLSMMKYSDVTLHVG